MINHAVNQQTKTFLKAEKAFSLSLSLRLPEGRLAVLSESDGSQPETKVWLEAGIRHDRGLWTGWPAAPQPPEAGPELLAAAGRNLPAVLHTLHGQLQQQRRLWGRLSAQPGVCGTVPGPALVLQVCRTARTVERADLWGAAMVIKRQQTVKQNNPENHQTKDGNLHTKKDYLSDLPSDPPFIVKTIKIMIKAHKNPEKCKWIASVLDLHHRFICRLQPDGSKVDPPPCCDHILHFCTLRNAELYLLDHLYRVFLCNDLGQRSEHLWCSRENHLQLEATAELLLLVVCRRGPADLIWTPLTHIHVLFKWSWLLSNHSKHLSASPAPPFGKKRVYFSHF